MEKIDGKFKRLEDYGIIGNLETTALVGRDGSIDWCCLPHVDSPSVFGAILDADKGGRFHVRPQGSYESHQKYVERTNVLTTIFDAPSGQVELTDFMPIRRMAKEGGKVTGPRAIVRKVACTKGEVEIEVCFRPRFDYGRIEGKLSRNGDGYKISMENQSLYLDSSLPLKAEGPSLRCSFRLGAGQVHWIFLRYGDDPIGESGENLLNGTVRYWIDWLHSSRLWRPILQGPWHEPVIRSALLLKLLTNAQTGAVIAAPTTSLPESLGGIRNWDYRYSWLRDSAFAIQAFEVLGYFQEAVDYFRWLKKVCHRYVEAAGPLNLRIAYTFDGRDIPPERDLEYLTGYRHSAPVRVGNAAFGQVQLDIYGEIINSFYLARGYEKEIIPRHWSFLRAMADYVCTAWKGKDSGIWELRSEPRHLTHSKLMCWVALDRCLRLAGEYGLDGGLDRWRMAREEIRSAILEKGFNRGLNSFVQSFDYPVLDSTGLLIPILGLVPANDPRVLGTIDAISRRLSDGEFLRRYEGEDGLPGKEGAFLLCSFWLVSALAMAGQPDRAEAEFMKILKYLSPLGLFAEEVDTRSGLPIGNFPQAFSHIGLINAALYLGKHQGREGGGPNLMGSGICDDGSS
ncbi:MAG: glycoside hydrolase family 15 protein [Acidobacteriota bacterium]